MKDPRIEKWGRSLSEASKALCEVKEDLDSISKDPLYAAPAAEVTACSQNIERALDQVQHAARALDRLDERITGPKPEPAVV